MTIEIYSPHDEGGGHFADTVFEGERDTHSRLLDKDDNPIAYKSRQSLGFDLRARPSSKCPTR